MTTYLSPTMRYKATLSHVNFAHKDNIVTLSPVLIEVGWRLMESISDGESVSWGEYRDRYTSRIEHIVTITPVDMRLEPTIQLFAAPYHSVEEINTSPSLAGILMVWFTDGLHYPSSSNSAAQPHIRWGIYKARDSAFRSLWDALDRARRFRARPTYPSW